MFKSYLQSFGLLNEKEIELFISASETRILKKAEYFIKGGEVCNQIAFVISGVFRSYYLSKGGDEITYCLTFPNSFMTAYSSYINCKGTHEYIQAITDSELLFIPKKAIEKLTNSSINCMRFSKVIAEQQYIELENRILQLQSQSATDRYRDIIENHQSFLQFIPLQYLASYLGITQRHLSRIRREIKF